jgi:hypothetical protein
MSGTGSRKEEEPAAPGRDGPDEHLEEEAGIAQGVRFQSLSDGRRPHVDRGHHSQDAVATPMRSGSGSADRAPQRDEGTRGESRMRGRQGFTFSIDVMPGAQVHFAGALWPAAEAEDKLSSRHTQNPWKTRVKKMTRVFSKEDAAERKNARQGKDMATGVSQCTLEGLVQAGPDLDDRAQGEPDWAVINKRGEAGRIILIRVSSCLTKAVNGKSMRSVALQFLANWIDARLLVVEQREAEQVLRGITLGETWT